MANGLNTAAWIQGLCTAIPTTLVAVVGAYALRSWRSDALGRRRINLAEAVLTSAWDLKAKIELWRSPLFDAGLAVKRRDEPAPGDERALVEANAVLDERLADVIRENGQFGQRFNLYSFYVGRRIRINDGNTKLEVDLAKAYSDLIMKLRFACTDVYKPESRLAGLSGYDNTLNAWYAFHGLPNPQGHALIDEDSARIRQIVNALERELRGHLRRRRWWRRLVDTILDHVDDSVTATLAKRRFAFKHDGSGDKVSGSYHEVKESD